MQQLSLSDSSAKITQRGAKRTWLKFKVVDGYELSEVRFILSLWAKSRSTPRKLFGAIKLFHALDTGDLDCFYQLLAEYFPVLNKYMTGKMLLVGQPAMLTHSGNQEITVIEMSAEDISSAARAALDELL